MTTPLYLSFFLHLIISVSADSAYVPSDNILLNCGSPSQISSLDGRFWTSDVGSKFAPSAQDKTSTISEASAQDPPVPQIPYMTARIFHSKLTYSLPVSSGPKFIRLYFFPASYSGLNKSNAFFSVSVGRFTLLRNFSASLTAEYLNENYFSREFCVKVERQRLNITFTPTPNSYGFVNGIEVVSMPDNLYFHGEQVSFVSHQSDFSIGNTTALEMVYRINVGGSDISPKDDTGLFRSWYDDTVYIFGQAPGVRYTNLTSSLHISYPPTVPPYTAPESVYRSVRGMGVDAKITTKYNLTWAFNIDSGFYYLFRLHFCEIKPEITQRFQRAFFIFIGNQTAESQADVIIWSGGNGIPVYKDYVVLVPDSGGKQGLWLALHPNDEIKPMYYDAILNGLEIFKLNKSNGDLAGPNPLPTRPVVGMEPPEFFSRRPSNSKNQSWTILAGIVGSAVIGVVALFFICFFVFRRRRASVAGTTEGTTKWVPVPLRLGSTNTTVSLLPSDLCRHFSITEIKAATNNFDDTRRIGVGGFGNVYKGYIDDGATTVAIKRGNQTSGQGAREFQTEIDLLTKLRHLHLVSLIGYCSDDQEMILVYEYMANGTFRDHLYGKNKPPLSWKQRLEICIGAARGLHYLHAGAKQPIIHRDVKTTNILLDEKWVGKVSDFGFSKVGPSGVSHTHVSTVVKGSLGYVDPEYYRRQQLTDKSDVYSFGVVLFEVLSARPALNPKLVNEQVCLADWAQLCHRRGTIDQIVDPYLRDKIAPGCLKKFVEIAKSCLADQGIYRPTMGDVLWSLEFALQLQVSVEDDSEDSGPFGGASSSGQVSCSESIIAGDKPLFSAAVFSEMMNSSGR